VYGQSPTINGTVADSANKTPLSGVIIQLLDIDGKILSYTFSKNDGTFSLSYSVNGKVLLFKNMGYRSQRVNVAENKSPLKIFLINEPVQLRDVVVKAPDILRKSDTLVYNVQKYADAQDRTIADVLKKMPGIEVGENGQIKYNGTPVNKFYIEGNDLLEGRYGLASNNISHKDVKNVEVLENHQPVRALQDIEFSEQAGLNLRLEEDAKLRWTGVVTGGAGGSPAIYDASLFAMRIGGKLQSMETARINNNGWDPASQSVRHTADNLFGAISAQNRLSDYITVGQSSTPIDDRRTRFNRSHLFNSTSSIQLKHDYNIKANITYEGDNLDFMRSAYTDYFDDFIPPLTETEDLRTREHTVSSQLILQSNTPKMYLKDNLSADLGWKSATSTITGSYLIGQNAEKPVFDIANELQGVKRIKNHVLTISSSNSIVNKPHSLSVETEGKTYFQDVAAFAFQSSTEASYGWIFGKWQLRGRAGLRYDNNALTSSLTGMDSDDFHVTNNSRLSRLNLYARPEIVYENNRLRLNPYVVINYYGYHFEAKEPEDRTTKNYGIISPTFSVRYKFTARLELFMNASYVTSPPATGIFYRGAIMNNYRYLSVGYPSYEANTGRSAIVSLRYRNPVSSLFANLACNYSNVDSPLTLEQLFVNDHIITTCSPAANSGESCSFNGGVSKGIFSGKIYIGVDAGYTQSEMSAIRNSNVVPYRSVAVFVMPKVKGTVMKWIATEYTLNLSKNTMTFKNSDAGSSYVNLKQKLTVSLFPVKKIQVFTGAEHYRTRFNDNTADNLLLLDAGARWMISDRIDINLSTTNLMNENDYHCSDYGTLSETIFRYRIRPRNVMISVQIRI
jgi:hypothetical protein